MLGEVFKDTTSFLAYLDKKKVVFSEQKLKRNQTKLENEINKENNSIIIIEDKEPKEKTSVSRRESFVFIDNGNENDLEKLKKESHKNSVVYTSCKFLRKLAGKYKNFQIADKKRHKSTSKDNSNKKHHHSKHIRGKNQSAADVAKYVDISTIKPIEEMISPSRKSFCVNFQSNLSFLSTNDLREILKAPKKKNNTQNNSIINTSNTFLTNSKINLKNQKLQNYLHKGSKDSNTNKTNNTSNTNSNNSPTSPQILEIKKKKNNKTFKKLFSLNTPNIKKKIYQIFGKGDTKITTDLNIDISKGNKDKEVTTNGYISSREKNKSKRPIKEKHYSFYFCKLFS